MNIGHQHPRLVAAIQEQAAKLCTVAPGFANDKRGEAARLIAELAPGDLEPVFFTNGGAEANENAIRMARLHTGRHKVLATYRSYHGATADRDHRHRRSAPLGQRADRGRAWCTSGARTRTGPPFHADRRGAGVRAGAGRTCATRSSFEGPATVAAVLLETVVGTNGILVPPPGYLAGVRQICDEFGIVLIADEVMAGFGRCGEWFAVDHWGVTPDLITFAKGVNSGYVPLGGVVISRPIAETFRERVVPRRAHLLRAIRSPAPSAVASIQIFKEEGIVEHARTLGEEVIGPALRELARAAPERRRGARPGRVLGPRAGPGPGDPGAAGALQRRRRRRRPDGRGRRRLQGARAVAVHPLQPGARGAAVHDHRRRGAPRASRSSTRRWTHRGPYARRYTGL